MRRWLRVLALSCLILAVVQPVLEAAPPVNLIYNVLAESIVNTSKGPRIVKPIIGFKRGTVANFQSLTQFLIEEPGVYTVRIDITGPDNRLRASDGPWPMEAKTANTTHSRLTHWSNVSFDKPGAYSFMVRVNDTLIARFGIVAE